MADVVYSDEQQRGIDKAVRWLDNFEYDPTQKVFRLIGSAGTGKTTVLKEIARRTKRRMRFAAFAGKAAMVLRQKGCKDAETLHKAIYEPRGMGVKKYREELEKLEGITEVGARKVHEAKLEQMRMAMNTPGFIRRLPQEFHYMTAWGVDEVSMVDKYIGQDLTDYGHPILACGDEGQLPPIMGTGFFFPPGYKADVELLHIHRQAAGSPVLRLATVVRKGNKLPYGKMGESTIVPKLALDEYLGFEQILCGTNKMRQQVNNAMRKIKGRVKVLEPGDKLICLQNNYEIGVMNGSQWMVVQCAHFVDSKGNQFYRAHIKSLDEEGVQIKTALIHLNPLLEGRPQFDQHWTPMLTGTPVALSMTYGDCMTVHKSQGSQWKSVCIIDDWNGPNYKEWLYTGITRAAERVTVVRDPRK